MSKKKQLFESLRLSLVELKKNNDTVNGVKINFKHADYGDFVQALNLLHDTDMPTYAPYENDIWVLIGNRQKKRNKDIEDEKYVYVNCDTQKFIDLENRRIQKLEEENNIAKFQTSFLKDMWPVFLGYVGIVIINIFAVVKFIKNRKLNQKSYI